MYQQDIQQRARNPSLFKLVSGTLVGPYEADSMELMQQLDYYKPSKTKP